MKVPEPWQAENPGAQAGMWLRVGWSKKGATKLPSLKVQVIGGPLQGSSQPGSSHEVLGSSAQAKLSCMQGPYWTSTFSSAGADEPNTVRPR